MMKNETPCENGDIIDFDDQDLRIINILTPNQKNKLEDLPFVSEETLRVYYRYLEEKLPHQLELTGRESTGYFSWEEAFEFGYGNDEQYNKLKKIKASYQDKYQFQALLNSDCKDGIITHVMRIGDQKIFDVPLSDLEVVDVNLDAWQIIEDYSMWIVNFND